LKLISAYIDEALEEHINNDTYIPGVNIFACFTYFEVNDTKVVILGQDPYPTIGRADGLSFSFGDGSRPKDSLKNIFKELCQDLGIVRTNTKLADWAKQGVLLLNCALSYINKDKQKKLINL
jgi:uracil-DNA glycosylase